MIGGLAAVATLTGVEPVRAACARHRAMRRHAGSRGVRARSELAPLALFCRQPRSLAAGADDLPRAHAHRQIVGTRLRAQRLARGIELAARLSLERAVDDAKWHVLLEKVP